MTGPVFQPLLVAGPRSVPAWARLRGMHRDAQARGAGQGHGGLVEGFHRLLLTMERPDLKTPWNHPGYVAWPL